MFKKIKDAIDNFFDRLFTSKSSLIRQNKLLSVVVGHGNEIAKSDKKINELHTELIADLKEIITGHEKLNENSEEIIRLSKLIMENNKATISKKDKIIKELNIINWDSLKEIDGLKAQLRVKEV